VDPDQIPDPDPQHYWLVLQTTGTNETCRLLFNRWRVAHLNRWHNFLFNKSTGLKDRQHALNSFSNIALRSHIISHQFPKESSEYSEGGYDSFFLSTSRLQ
jgi:hypothetical protein